MVSGKTAGISCAVWILGLLSCLDGAQPCSSEPHREPETDSHPTGSLQRTAVTFTLFLSFLLPLFFSLYIFKAKRHKFTLVICVKWRTSVLQHAFFTWEMEIPLTWGKREVRCPPPIPSPPAAVLRTGPCIPVHLCSENSTRTFLSATWHPYALSRNGFNLLGVCTKWKARQQCFEKRHVGSVLQELMLALQVPSTSSGFLTQPAAALQASSKQPKHRV